MNKVLCPECKIENKIKKIIAKKLEVKLDRVVPEASIMCDLGADSLGHVDFIMELENKFDIDISYNDAQKILTVKDAIEYIRREI